MATRTTDDDDCGLPAVTFQPAVQELGAKTGMQAQAVNKAVMRLEKRRQADQQLQRASKITLRKLIGKESAV